MENISPQEAEQIKCELFNNFKFVIPYTALSDAKVMPPFDINNIMHNIEDMCNKVFGYCNQKPGVDFSVETGGIRIGVTHYTPPDRRLFYIELVPVRYVTYEYYESKIQEDEN